jgi:ferritin-like metal-binding protein YciE
MSENAEQQLIKELSNAHAIEKQAIQLLDKGAQMVEDEEIGRIFRAHRLQTEEHEREVSACLEAHGESPSKIKDMAMQVGALGIGASAMAQPETTLRLITVAYAFENLEIATYGIIRRLAEFAGDAGTAAVAQRILEQEEAAAELVRGTFNRVVELTLGEPPTSPLPGVTPLGKPSERGPEPYESGGPQDFKDKPADASLGQPKHVDRPVDGDHLASPEPGYPTEQTKPYGDEVPDPEHAEPIGSTTPNRDRS